MIRYFSVLLVLVNIVLSAQNYRVVYELKFKRDSLKDKYDTQNMILDVTTTGTKFYYAKLLQLDSLSKKGIMINVSFPLQQIVKKERGTTVYTNYFSIDGQYFQYGTENNIQWKIQEDTRNTPDGLLQKATTSFGGRNWEAWFSRDITLQEGPFKFSGLPGLVFEIRDTRNNFVYKLISIEKQNKEFDTENIVETSLGIKPIIVSEKQFSKLMLDKYRNPFSEFENRNEGEFGFQYKDRHITTKKELYEIKSSYQKEMRENYNPVELDRAVRYE